MGSPDLIALAAATLHVEGSPERILEIGCGDGERTLFLAREYPAARVRGVDASDEEIHAAGNRIGLDPEGRVVFRAGSATNLPFPDDHFDLVVMRRLCRAIDVKAAAPGRRGAEIARVLRLGGTLIGFSGARPRDRLGLRARRERRWLGRRGFELLQSGGAGGGTYLVARLS